MDLVGYPSFVSDKNMVTAMYRSVVVEKEDYFANIMTSIKTKNDPRKLFKKMMWVTIGIVFRLLPIYVQMTFGK